MAEDSFNLDSTLLHSQIIIDPAPDSSDCKRLVFGSATMPTTQMNTFLTHKEENQECTSCHGPVKSYYRCQFCRYKVCKQHIAKKRKLWNDPKSSAQQICLLCEKAYMQFILQEKHSQQEMNLILEKGLNEQQLTEMKQEYQDVKTHYDQVKTHLMTMVSQKNMEKHEKEKLINTLTTEIDTMNLEIEYCQNKKPEENQQRVNAEMKNKEYQIDLDQKDKQMVSLKSQMKKLDKQINEMEHNISRKTQQQNYQEQDYTQTKRIHHSEGRRVHTEEDDQEFQKYSDIYHSKVVFKAQTDQVNQRQLKDSGGCNACLIV